MCENIKAAVEAAGGTMADICGIVDVFVHRTCASFDVPPARRCRRAFSPCGSTASTMDTVRGFSPSGLPDRDERQSPWSQGLSGPAAQPSIL